MIKIQKTDTIIDILSKIKNSKDFNIVLEFPFWHPILHNYLSLKIIKSKVWSKTLIIVTNDISSRKLWKSLWIKYSIVKNEKFIEKENLLKHNFTFYQYLKFEINKYKNDFKNMIFWNSKINELKNYKEKYVKQKTPIAFFLFGLIISSIMLVFVFYFAVNKSYVYITPEITVKTRWKNILFVESEEDSIMDRDNIIWVQKFSKLVTIQDNFKTTWIKEDSVSRATWKVTIFNKTSESMDFVDKTRLKSWNWILYEIEWAVSVPSATLNEKWEVIPWSVDTKIISKIYDIDWTFIWEKWNIWSWVILTFPWLWTDLETQLYANTITDIKWWWNNKEKFLSNEDLMRSEKVLEWRLRESALKEIKKYLNDKNNNSNSKYEILDLKDLIKYTQLDIKKVWNIVVWDKIENFSLNWSINIEAYIYNKDVLINKLKTVANEWILSDVEKISSVNEKSLRVANLISKTDNPLQIKATVELDFFILHIFSDDWDDYYIDRLKNSILWLDKEEAEKILLNDKQISDVHIDIKPFFIKKLPKIPDNIIFKIQN